MDKQNVAAERSKELVSHTRHNRLRIHTYSDKSIVPFFLEINDRQNHNTYQSTAPHHKRERSSCHPVIQSD